MYASTWSVLDQKVKFNILTKTESELVARSDAFLVKVSVINVESFGVIIVTTDDRSAIVRCLLRDGVWKLAARGGRSVQNVG